MHTWVCEIIFVPSNVAIIPTFEKQQPTLRCGVVLFFFFAFVYFYRFGEGKISVIYA